MRYPEQALSGQQGQVKRDNNQQAHKLRSTLSRFEEDNAIEKIPGPYMHTPYLQQVTANAVPFVQAATA